MNQVGHSQGKLLNFWDEWKLTHNIPKFMRYHKQYLRRKFYSCWDLHLKKKDFKSVIYLKKLEKEKKIKHKERKKRKIRIKNDTD